MMHAWSRAKTSPGVELEPTHVGCHGITLTAHLPRSGDEAFWEANVSRLTLYPLISGNIFPALLLKMVYEC
jgi:hypothetical protein